MVNEEWCKVVIEVRLEAHEGEKLMSRSQAKQLLAKIEPFKQVVLDFEQVESVGQAFADEVFRVFSNTRPKIQLQAINTTPAIEQMISRAKSS